MKSFSQQLTFALVIATLTVAAFLMANVELPSWSHAVSALSVFVFAIPAMWAAKMWLGWRNASVLFIAAAAFALLIETAAILTGFPYGHFGYSDHLGSKLFGVVPWTVALAWTPLLLGAYSIAANVTTTRPARIVLTTVTLVLFDLVLDPGAVYLGFWTYAESGAYYGVPLSNFAGWLLSGLIGASLLDVLVAYFRPLLPVPVQLAASAFFILFFWTAFALFAGMAVPTAVGALTLSGTVLGWRRFHYFFDDKIVLVDEENRPIGTASKLEAHDADTKLHRAFSVFIFNEKGELLLQQRALTKKTWPGVWSNSCCGHVMAHESIKAAAARRLKYELGMSGIDMKVVLPTFRYRAENDGVVENEICPVLVGFTDAVPSINTSEVANVRWVKWEEFLASLDEAAIQISPWAIKEVRLLADNDVFRKCLASRVPETPTPSVIV